jgi:hypothetical protein
MGDIVIRDGNLIHIAEDGLETILNVQGPTGLTGLMGPQGNDATVSEHYDKLIGECLHRIKLLEETVEILCDTIDEFHDGMLS